MCTPVHSMPVHKQDQTRDQPATSKAKVTVNPTDLKQFHTSLLTIHKQCPDCNTKIILTEMQEGHVLTNPC